MSSAAEDLLIRHRLTVGGYHRMGEGAILKEESRVESIDGEIIDMALFVRRHAGTASQLSMLLEGEVGDRAIVWPQIHLFVTTIQSLGSTSRCCAPDCVLQILASAAG